MFMQAWNMHIFFFKTRKQTAVIIKSMSTNINQKVTYGISALEMW